MEIYHIKDGTMRQVPDDWELRQTVKYILVFLSGMAFVGILRACAAPWIG